MKGGASIASTITHSRKEGILWDGQIDLREASLKSKLFGVDLSIDGINGTIPLKKEKGEGLGGFLETPLLTSKAGKKLFRSFLNSFTQDSKDVKREELLSIDRIDYGFFGMHNVKLNLGVYRNGVHLKQFQFYLYGGQVLVRGFFEFLSQDSNYNLSFLFKGISLRAISRSIFYNEDYISGLVNGIGWVGGEESELNKLGGLARFWTVKSKSEPRKIGKALLERLGMRSRWPFSLTGARSYDEGKGYLYIKDGFITFKELRLSNTTLGIKDLLIRVDPMRNSISLANFLSVIKESGKRKPKIQIGK